MGRRDIRPSVWMSSMLLLVVLSPERCNDRAPSRTLENAIMSFDVQVRSETPTTLLKRTVNTSGADFLSATILRHRSGKNSGHDVSIAFI